MKHEFWLFKPDLTASRWGKPQHFILIFPLKEISSLSFYGWKTGSKSQWERGIETIERISKGNNKFSAGGGSSLGLDIPSLPRVTLWFCSYWFNFKASNYISWRVNAFSCLFSQCY